MFSMLFKTHIFNLRSPLDGLSNAENRLLSSFYSSRNRVFIFSFYLEVGLFQIVRQLFFHWLHVQPLTAPSQFHSFRFLTRFGELYSYANSTHCEVSLSLTLKYMY